MAVEVEASGQVDEFLKVLKQRAWWIIVPTIVLGSLGAFLAVVVPKKYVSRTEIMVGNPGAAGVSTADEGYVAPYSLKANTRIETVLNQLNWTEFKPLNQAERYEYIQELTKGLRVSLPTMPKDSRKQRVEISFKSTSRARAKEFLTQLFKSWKDEVLQGQLAREKSQERETKGLLADLRQEFQRTRERILSLRTEFNIAPPRIGVGGQMITESSPVFEEAARLEQLIASKVQELDQAESDFEVREKVHDRMPLEKPPTANNADPVAVLVGQIDQQIERLELLHRQSAQTPQHSAFKKRERAIQKLRIQRTEIVAQARSQASSDLEPGAMVDNPERIALGLELEQRRDRIEQLRGDISRARVRKDEVDARAFKLNNALSQIEQLNVESSILSEEIGVLAQKANNHEIRVANLETPAGNPFEIQLAPTDPLTPTDPNPWVIGIAGIVMGLGLGLGLAVLKEYGRSVFRSPRELARVMPYPVLGTINSIRTRRERARALLVRGVLGGGSLLFLLSMSYVTWAWANNRDGLTDSLVDAIDSFRELLM